MFTAALYDLLSMFLFYSNRAVLSMSLFGEKEMVVLSEKETVVLGKKGTEAGNDRTDFSDEKRSGL